MPPDLIDAIAAEACADQRKWADMLRILAQEAIQLRHNQAAQRRFVVPPSASRTVEVTSRLKPEKEKAR